MDVSAHVWTFRLMGDSPIDVDSPHRRNVYRPFAPKTFRLTRILIGVIPVTYLLGEEDNSVHRKENMCLCALHDEMHISFR